MSVNCVSPGLSIRVAMATMRPQIVIVGAGIAGLSAAVELTKAGFTDVTVLEAMDRPGGRAHTVTALGIENLELGATWLHGDKDNPLYTLAQQNNLLRDNEVKVHPAGDKFYTEQGDQVDLDFVLDFWSKLDDITDQAYKGGPKDNCESFKSVGKACTQILREFTGRADIPDAVEVLCSRWHSNPYICGAYTNVPVGCKAEASDVLAEPLPGCDKCHVKEKSLQVLFAGEATITPYITTTHGAFSSGKREAIKLIDLYRCKH
ncbi:SMOX [Branchiostoma lanceolatum]|uniref:SMOX protein n=1 Tax=Branchiostoma lanceolatum TaxID=7740 RepID=A0A8K0AEY1_BRALA|nr:SMOX [Branchiostoma lanceolatum]